MTSDQEMRIRLTTIIGVALLGIAIVIVLSRDRANPDAPTGGTGSHETANPKRSAPDRATHRSSKQQRSSQRKSSEELIRRAELLLKAGNHEAALELAELLAGREPIGKYALPPQLQSLLRVWRENPDYVGEILTIEDPSHGSFVMSTNLTPAMLGRASPSGHSGDKEVSEEESFKVVPPHHVIVRYSVENLGNFGSVENLEHFKEGDVVKVWAGPLMLSFQPQVNALRIEKEK
jgi:hypothetical protein